MQRFDFKISIIAIELFLVMILNIFLFYIIYFSILHIFNLIMVLKSDFEVTVLQRVHQMAIFHKLI